MKRLDCSSHLVVRIVLCLVLALVLSYTFLGEKVAYNDGAGWDGVFYREVVQNFSEDYFNGLYDQYHIQRVFPFAIMNLIYNVFDISKDNFTIMWGAVIMNSLVILTMVCYFFRLSTMQKWNISTEIIGFASLFYTMGILKYYAYYPLALDPFALLIALMSVYYYLKNYKGSMCLLALVSMFSWPFMGLCILIMAWFPKDEIRSVPILSRKSQFMLTGTKLLFIFWHTILFIALVALIFIRQKGIETFNSFWWCTAYVNMPMLVVAVLCIPIFYYLALSPIKVDIIEVLRSLLKPTNLKREVIAFFLFVSFYFLSKYYANSTSPFSLFQQLLALIFHPLTAPFVFIETLFLYFGLPFIMCILLWKKMICEFQKYGVGYCVLIVISLFMSLDIDSRKLITFLPVFIMPLLNVINRMNLRSWVPVAYSIYSLIFSFFWYNINVPGIEQAFDQPFNTYDTMPAQRWFMFSGPWQSHTFYYIFISLGVVTAVFVMWLYKRGYIIQDRTNYED